VYLDQLAEWVAAEQWPKSSVDELDEVRPRWLVVVPFEQRVPLRGIARHVEGGEEDFPCLRCLLDLKELVTPVEPQEGIL
jgi:hypothetical protein